MISFFPDYLSYKNISVPINLHFADSAVRAIPPKFFEAGIVVAQIVNSITQKGQEQAILLLAKAICLQIYRQKQLFSFIRKPFIEKLLN